MVIICLTFFVALLVIPVILKSAYINKDEDNNDFATALTAIFIVILPVLTFFLVLLITLKVFAVI